MDISSTFRMDGLTILVTGASGAIGQAIAVACAEAGSQVIIHGRDTAILSELIKILPGTGHQVMTADFNNISEIFELADSCPLINGIVHNAGIHGVAPMHLVSTKQIEQVQQINYTAPVALTQRILFKKKLAPGGSILFISSIAAKTGTHGVGPYSGSKSAILGMMKPLALEVAKRKIRVNALCPGIVRAGLFKGQEDWLDKEVAPKYPLGLGEPEDIAHAAVFFMSKASEKITGSEFNLDGGIPFI